MEQKQMNLTSFGRSFGTYSVCILLLGSAGLVEWLHPSVSFIALSLENALFISVRDIADKLFSHRMNSVFPRLGQIGTN